VLPVTGAAPVLAEETAGVEPAGKAERAAAAKSEKLAPWMQGETRHEVKTLREGRRTKVETLREGRCKVETLPQEGRCVHEPPPEALPRKRKREVDNPKPEVLPQKGECKPEVLPRECECERARTGAKPKPKVEAPARKGEREYGTTPQGNTNEGECEPSWPL